jgi:hypothetical protein
MCFATTLRLVMNSFLITPTSCWLFTSSTHIIYNRLDTISLEEKAYRSSKGRYGAPYEGYGDAR